MKSRLWQGFNTGSTVSSKNSHSRWVYHFHAAGIHASLELQGDLSNTRIFFLERGIGVMLDEWIDKYMDLFIIGLWYIMVYIYYL